MLLFKSNNYSIIYIYVALFILMCSFALEAFEHSLQWESNLDKELHDAVFDLNLTRLSIVLEQVPSNYIIIDITDPAGPKPKTLLYFALEAAVWFEKRALVREKLERTKSRYVITQFFPYISPFFISFLTVRIYRSDNEANATQTLCEKNYHLAMWLGLTKMLNEKIAQEEIERNREEQLGYFLLSDVYHMVQIVVMQPSITLDKQTEEYLEKLKQVNPDFEVLKLFDYSN